MTLNQKIRWAGAVAVLATASMILASTHAQADPVPDPVLSLSQCQAQQGNQALPTFARQVAAACVQILTEPTPAPTPSPSSSPTPSPSSTPSQSPTPSPTGTGSVQWQDAPYGVPAGTVVSNLAIPNCTITQPMTIDAKVIDGCGVLFVKANVTFTRSIIMGTILADQNLNWKITLDQSFVDGKQYKGAAVSNVNLHITNTEIRGAAASVQCSAHCYVKDSWLHGQYAPVGAGWHDDAFITNGADDMTLIHNRIVCDEGHGACSGDVFLAADFARVTHVTVDNNLIGADANVQYCAWGGSNRLGSDHISYTNNVFQRGANRKCGKYGPVTLFDPAGAGNIWTNNRWDDGALVPPSNAGP